MGKFLTQLRKLEGAVDTSQPGLDECIKTPSPAVNWAFGTPGGGLPLGTIMLLYGPPKGGKSLICSGIIGQLHSDDPEAVAVVFNTELRGRFQMSDSSMEKFGVDPERLVVYDANQPEHIFDRIENDIAKACQEGEKIKLVIIDSITDIRGRRTQNAETVLQQQIGDHALTVKDGLQRILTTVRKYNIALILTDHVRAEMDQREQMRGNTIKMASAWATKHRCEFFCFVEPNRSKDGKVNLAGEEFTDKEVLDFMEKAQVTGHKIRFKVVESSFPKKGRTAEFTIDYEKGFINQYEEIFTLAVNYGIIKRPNNVMYQYGEKQWRGVVACLLAIKEDPVMQRKLLEEVKSKDNNEVVAEK